MNHQIFHVYQSNLGVLLGGGGEVNKDLWDTIHDTEILKKQAGAVLGQAQLKLGLDFISINLH